MPAAGRLGDKSQVPADSHGCPGCPHPSVGPAVSGSGNVNINGRPALRVGDQGIHAACCGPNTWEAVQGARGVFINGKAAHRLGDADRHCGGTGKLIEGSPNVFIGDYAGGGTGKAPPSYEGGFQLLDENGDPLVDVGYVIRTQSGQEYRGRTDESGHTELVYTDEAEEISIEVLPDGPCGS